MDKRRLKVYYHSGPDPEFKDYEADMDSGLSRNDRHLGFESVSISEELLTYNKQTQ